MSERKPHLWCLFQKNKNRLIQGLLFDEARAFVSNLDSSELEHWMAWKEEWPDWKPVDEIEGLSEMIYRILTVSPPPPPGTIENVIENSTQAINAPSNRSTALIQAEPSTQSIPSIQSLPLIQPVSGLKIIEKTSFSQTIKSEDEVPVTDFIVRDKKRFKKRMQITIIGAQKIFKTFTRDVSVGGMYLEDSLPDWVNGNFKARIAKQNSKQQIELTCCVIANQPNGGRFRLAILPLTSIQDEKNLEIWLAA